METLIKQLEELLAEAKEGQFGDFTNEKYATPKIALRTRLLKMAENVALGEYDD